MRILYISDAMSVHTRRWAESFRDAGDEVHVASFRPAQLPGIAVHVLPTFGMGRAGYALAVPFLRRLARRLQPDVFHAQYLTSYGFIAAMAGLHPLVSTAWGSDVLVSPRQSSLARALVGVALRAADQVTTVAEHMNAAVVALGGSPDKVIAAPFGVDVELFRPPATGRAEPPPLRIICTRNFAPVYSVHTVIDAVGQLHRENVELRLELVGDGPLRSELEGRVQGAGLREVVRFHGHVDHPRLVSLLGQAHLFVSPALSDGNNVSLNEAMACGCFPVATDIAANSQWIDNGRNGLLFAAGDAAALAGCLRRAGRDSSLRAQAQRENRRIVEQRADWRHSMAAMRDIYDRLAHGQERR